MHVIKLQSKLRDYEVHFVDGERFKNVFDRYSDCIYVIDSNVWRLHADGYLSCLKEKDVVVFPVSEERKCLSSVEELYEKFMERSAKKNMTMVSIGGGIVQDVTGFVATTLYRGINWVFCPTTLLAQADSCIGSKTSLNFKGYKNLAGTFYPPSRICIYTPFIDSLEEQDYFSGLGEVAKLHLMGGVEMTSRFIEKLPLLVVRDRDVLSREIADSLRVKQSYMEGDEFDTGRRNLLNFGHCFGHALESVSNYTIPHGQAVVIGMLFAIICAKNRALLSSATCESLANGLLLPILTTFPSHSDLEPGRILDAMKQDKKRVGQGLVVVLMKDDHTFVKVIDFTPDELLAALKEMVAVLKIE